MKLMTATAPRLVEADIADLEEHGFHPAADPGRLIQDRRVLSGVPTRALVASLSSLMGILAWHLREKGLRA